MPIVGFPRAANVLKIVSVLHLNWTAIRLWHHTRYRLNCCRASQQKYLCPMFLPPLFVLISLGPKRMNSALIFSQVSSLSIGSAAAISVKKTILYPKFLSAFAIITEPRGPSFSPSGILSGTAHLLRYRWCMTRGLISLRPLWLEAIDGPFWPRRIKQFLPCMVAQTLQL